MRKLFFTSMAKNPVIGYGKVAIKLKEALGNSDIELTGSPEKTDIQIYYGQPFKENARHYKRQCNTFLTYTMFESTIVPNGWVDFINEHEGFLTPSRWCADWFKDNGVKVPIDILHHGVDPDEFPFIERPRDREYFTFIWQGVNPNDRKGGDVVRHAFRKLRLNKARLIMKGVPLASPRLYINHWGIEEIIDFYSQGQMTDLFRKADFSINPTRGEGFGLIPLEHASTGLDVAVTGFSGCREYLKDVSMHPIKWTPNTSYFTKVLKDDFGTDALPDFGHICEIMMWAYKHRDEVRERGKKLSQAVHERWTWERPISQLKEILPKYAE